MRLLPTTINSPNECPFRNDTMQVTNYTSGCSLHCVQHVCKLKEGVLCFNSPIFPKECPLKEIKL